ncbi:MAG: chemotaxis protein CheW, partial [Gemmatimonadetes bacterium]|nr:chemotaxis protein CheW [Gemmatimonadota bacterium]
RRASALGRVPADSRKAESTPAVVFQLSGENYAIDARVVLQVHVLRDLTPLAGARPPLFGVTHWRGQVLTILDLREQLGVRTGGLTDLSRVIVIDGGRYPFGILADASRDLMELTESMIRPLSAEDGSARNLLRGITDDTLLVMDTDAVLKMGRAAAAHEDNIGRGG